MPPTIKVAGILCLPHLIYRPATRPLKWCPVWPPPPACLHMNAAWSLTSILTYLSEPCLFFPPHPPISQPLPCSFIMSSHVEVMICEPTSECMHCGNDPLFHTWASSTRPYEEEISPADTRRSHLLCSFSPSSFPVPQPPVPPPIFQNNNPSY